MKPKITKGVVLHRNFVEAERTLQSLVLACGGDEVVALVGCTRAGKSTLFNRLVALISASTAGHGKGIMPSIHLRIETSQDGRISPKYLTLQMLKAVDHPKYAHFGEMDEARHYTPSRGFDESSMRTALTAALLYRQSKIVLIDEAHHLTHTPNERLRSHVLQSVKCLCAIDRTLVMVGGYELAVRGLFDSAHFAGRLHVIDFPPYGEGGADLDEWDKIVKRMGSHLPLANRKLLVDEAEWLRRATNGSVGLLEKLLFSCKVAAQAHSVTITRAMLREHAPTQKENEAILRDIESGQEALSRYSVARTTRIVAGPSKKPRRPFQQRPTRRRIGPEGLND